MSQQGSFALMSGLSAGQQDVAPKSDPCHALPCPGSSYALHWFSTADEVNHRPLGARREDFFGVTIAHVLDVETIASA